MTILEKETDSLYLMIDSEKQIIKLKSNYSYTSFDSNGIISFRENEMEVAFDWDFPVDFITFNILKSVIYDLEEEEGDIFELYTYDEDDRHFFSIIFGERFAFVNKKQKGELLKEFLWNTLEGFTSRLENIIYTDIEENKE